MGARAGSMRVRRAAQDAGARGLIAKFAGTEFTCHDWQQVLFTAAAREVPAAMPYHAYPVFKRLQKMGIIVKTGGRTANTRYRMVATEIALALWNDYQESIGRGR